MRRPSQHGAPPEPARGVPLLVAAVVIVAAVTLTSCNPTPESGARFATVPTGEARGLPAVVERLVDGDTVIVNVAGRTETVRLLGIDTPEKEGGPRPAECFGAQASTFLGELLPVGTPILLTRDHETRDQYSRLLAFVHRAGDGLFVNLAMVEHGYANPLFFPPNTSVEPQFTDAANRARRNWLGFWPACGAADVTLQVDDPTGAP